MDLVSQDKLPAAPVAVDPGSLIQRAIDKGLPLESLERLLAMRRELKAEWAKEQFFRSLATFQKVCPTILKSSNVDFTNKKGYRTRYKYASMDEIVEKVKDLLEANGFSYTIKTEQTKDEVTAICEAHHIEGHTEVTRFSIPVDHESYMNDAQKVASAMTYSKRYALCNAFGIMTGDPDDDARTLTKEEPAGPVQVHPVPEQEPAGMENWRWVEVLDSDGKRARAPQGYWANKGNREAQQLALTSAFGPAPEYKVEKTENGWQVFRKIGVTPEPGQQEFPLEQDAKGSTDTFENYRKTREPGQDG